MDAVHVSTNTIFLTHPAFTMSSSDAVSPFPTSPGATSPGSGPVVSEKKKKCCPFGDCRIRMKPADTLLVCRCGVSFCPTHRLPEQHACGFNFRTAATQLLSTQLVKCAGDRLVDKL